MNSTIRNEETKDYFFVENVFRESFWNLYFPGCLEHFTAHCIRQHKDFIPELSFVLEINGEIAGAILYTLSHIASDNGKQITTVSFGPAAILPQFQGKGYGRMLIERSIEEAKKMGYPAVMICGYPYHYHSYGFTGTKKYHISMPDGNYYTGVMALPLYEGALDNISGIFHFSEVFAESENKKEELELFDQKFPIKEKLVLPSHAEYEAALFELDNNDYR